MPSAISLSLSLIFVDNKHANISNLIASCSFRKKKYMRMETKHLLRILLRKGSLVLRL